VVINHLKALDVAVKYPNDGKQRFIWDMIRLQQLKDHLIGICSHTLTIEEYCGNLLFL
jgi:hypothetical protein